MVVVFIIGLLVVGAILSLGATGRDSQMERERDRLAAIMTYMHERAGMLTLEYGIRCGVHGYRIVYFDNRTMQWVPENVDDTLRLRKLPSGLALQLTVEGHQIVLDDKALTIPKMANAAGVNNTLGSMPKTFMDQDASNTPQIMLFSNGDTNAFVLKLVREGVNRSASLQPNADGSIAVGDIVEPKS
jgi:hypothetical protein